MSIDWQPWGPEAFERARREGKPALLLLSGVVAGELGPSSVPEGRFIPVFCDHRDRPDLARRFEAPGGVAVLDGGGNLVASPDVDPKALGAMLSRIAADYKPDARPAQAKGPSPAPWTGAVGFSSLPELDAERPRAYAAELAGSKTALHYFGLELLIHAASEWNDVRAGRLVSAQLERWRRGRFAPELWSASYFLRMFSDVAALTGSEEFAQTSRDLGRLLLRQWTPGRLIERPFLGEEARAYADGNAQAALALLRLSALGEGEAREAALDLLAALEKDYYDPLLGMAHRKSVDGGPIVYGLLDDNAWTALAFTEAYSATGRKAYREFADGLARFMFQELWDRDRGAFLDRIPQKGDLAPLTRPARPIYENAVALEVLWRLHHMKGNTNYKRWLDWGLRSLLASASGPDQAPLLRVQHLLQGGRFDLELVGRLDDPKTAALLQAANAQHLPRKIVSFVDPDDQDYILAHKLEAPSYPRLFVCDESLRPVAGADDPRSVPEAIASAR